MGISLLAALTAEQVATLPPPAREDAVRAVADAFSDPELAAGIESTHEPALGALAYFTSLLGNVLEKVLGGLKGLYVSQPWLYWALLVFLSLLLVALIVHIAWTFSLAFRGIPGPAAEEAARAERARRFLEIREQARSLAAEGRHKEAVRELLLALIALVEERKILSVARGWTIREIIARVARRTGAAQPLDMIERIFEDVWYGGESITGSQFAVCDGSLDAFVRELSAASPEDLASRGRSPS